MSATAFGRAAELFLRAKDLGLAARDAMLARECGQDTELRAHVERLLAGAERPLPFADLADDLQEGDERGTRIGPYKLLQKLGEGGFGLVYMAEQEAPVRRQVALKILKLGMDTKQVIARFEAERQALALMDHPNIARVFDAGATPAGRPFFVMELIRGVPITEYCDKQQLAMPARLALFVQVCQAIQHAHQKGIIHRDIKPSNVLVTLHDGTPVPKVIDFGIAKATAHQRLTDKTLFTEFRHMIGTPEYMSPEQAEMSGLDIDTRADVYALGVLLYELLTGTTPFDREKLRGVSRSEVERILREQEPETPSKRLQTRKTAELEQARRQAGGATTAATTTARQRHRDSRTLTRQLRGDLDWIVMKCLEKDRARRYETCNDLARDVGRYLASQPVQAGPPSTLYLLSRFARRNRAWLATGAVVVAALLAGSAFAAWGWFTARHERDVVIQCQKDSEEEARRARAAERGEHEQRVAAEQAMRLLRSSIEREQAETKKATALYTLVLGMLSAASPVESGRRDYTVREMLDDCAASLGRRFADDHDAECQLRFTIGAVYRNLAVPDRAEQELERALACARSSEGPGALLVANVLNQLAQVRLDRGDAAGAERLAREGLSAAGDAQEDGPMRERWHLQIALARALHRQGKVAEAEPLLRAAVAAWDRPGTTELMMASMSLNELAALLQARGEFAQAEPLLRKALAMRRQLHGDRHVFVASSMHNLAVLLFHVGKYAEAEPLYRDALRMRRELLGNGHPNVARSCTNLATFLQARGELDEALALQHEALATMRALHAGDHLDVALNTWRLAALHCERGELDAAEPLAREAHAMFVRLFGNDQERVAQSLLTLGAVLRGRGAADAARERHREALAILKRRFKGPHPVVATALLELARDERARADAAAAEPLAREALAMLRRVHGREHPELAPALLELGGLLTERGAHAEAAPLLSEHQAIRERLRGTWCQTRADH